MSQPDVRSSILHQLAEFAATAEFHANQQHQVTLQPGRWKALDGILDCERDDGDPADHESLVLCYGAWVGQCLVKQHGATWTALQEPVPPRIELDGEVYSPLDAVRRRLSDRTAPMIQQLIDRIPAARPSPDSSFSETNRAAWNRLAGDPRFVNRNIDPTMNREQVNASLDPWLREISLSGQRVLCLAAGGGLHGPLLAQAGASVTVVDFSPVLLEFDERAAKQNGLDLKILQTDLCDLSAIKDEHFDIVIQPVSACYIPDLQPMYSEIRRVLKRGGRYLSQQKSPGSLQAGRWESTPASYVMKTYCTDGLRLPPAASNEFPHREPGMVEYVHTFDAILGGLCRNGFVIDDFQEPVRSDLWAAPNSAEHRAHYFPPYLKILATKVA